MTLSREHVRRSVTQPLERMNTGTLVALCEALGCAPNDLSKPKIVNARLKKTADGRSEPLPLDLGVPGGAVVQPCCVAWGGWHPTG
ncbi:helix-turn-helix domain-containing protein [Streptomyces sp. IBSBF 2806]|uniref:helix-turn-helix domain-containing protein n=1 Tax=Streptomyces sp. IBSBF 2806 TaxID=2903529 RepID=UPI002FDBBC52